MKVIYVATLPPTAAINARRPALTPELLAASAARTSRNNEGIEKIMEMIDKDDPDKSIDSIFKFADYGHRSITGLTGGIAMFMEGLSLLQIYELFREATTGDGQETSTRYVNFSNSGILPAVMAGIPQDVAAEYESFAQESGEYYEQLTTFWTEVATDNPSVMGIPDTLINQAASGDHKANLKLDRLRRNYVFDRARYAIPVCMLNNMVLIQPARAWADMIADLNSHYRPESRALGAMLLEELKLVAPRMVKHAGFNPERADYLLSEFQDLSKMAFNSDVNARMISEQNDPHDVDLKVFAPPMMAWAEWGRTPHLMTKAFAQHKNRYLPIGSQIKRAAVRFTIYNLAMAELRDLNRHRPGNKFCPLIPVGIYLASEQIPECARSKKSDTLFPIVRDFLRGSAMCARNQLVVGNHNYIYGTQLGTQYEFEHTTTLDKYIYEAELRTGPGVHFRYAAQIRATLHELYSQYPEFKGLVLEGSAEPE